MILTKTIQTNIFAATLATILSLTAISNSVTAQPVVLNISVTTTDSSATLNFDTDIATTALVDYGLTGSYGSQDSSITLATSHSILLDSLAENTLFHYQITVEDVVLNQTITPDSTFMTDDVTGPQISNLAIATTDTSATITFDTDEPANSVLDWGLTAVYDSTQADTNFVTSHFIVVDSLDENTPYHYMLTLEDSLGNQTVTADSSFMTADVTAPVISGVIVSDTTFHTVRFQFTTDEPTTAEIEIDNYQARDDSLRTTHDIVVDVMQLNTQNRFTRLLSGETYSADIIVTDSSGNVTSDGSYIITTDSYIEEPLPASWLSSDVGAVGLAGFSTYDSVTYGGSFRLVGSGTQLYWDVDDFHFAYTEVSGDFEFTVQVRSYAGLVTRNTKASTHFRENLNAGSRMFNQSINYDDTDRLYYRDETDSNHVDILRTDLQSSAGDSLWARLVRSGNTFTEYYSDDGSNWTVHGPVEGTNVKLPTSGLVGMTSLSRNNNSYSEIIYSDVSLVLPADTTPPVIVDFEALGDLDTLRISFNASENVTTVLEYGYFVPYSDSLISDTLRSDNFFMLTDLDEGVEYNYRIVMTDNGGNVVVDLNRTYTWGVLPIELTEFNVVQNNGDAVLRWATATETNGTQFYIEVAGPTEEFESIGSVDAVGQSTSRQEYAFTVNDLEPGTHRFRLRHVDTEGLSTLSDEVEIDISMQDTYDLSEVYPNPFNPSATFTLRVKSEQQLEIAVYDMLGREVQNLYSAAAEANHKYTFELDGSRLSSGVYIVRVAGELFAQTRKVTLLK